MNSLPLAVSAAEKHIRQLNGFLVFTDKMLKNDQKTSEYVLKYL
jgi:hypothetical protein